MLTGAGKDWLARVGNRGRALDFVRAHTHVSVWTDPASDDLQARIAEHLKAATP